MPQRTGIHFRHIAFELANQNLDIRAISIDMLQVAYTSRLSETTSILPDFSHCRTATLLTEEPTLQLLSYVSLAKKRNAFLLIASAPKSVVTEL